MLGVVIVILLGIVAVLIIGAPFWLLLLWLLGNRIERRRRAEDEKADARTRDWQQLDQTCPECGRRLVSALSVCPNCGAYLKSPPS